MKSSTRFGHSTKYSYTTDGFINRVVLPSEQILDGQLETYASRELLIPRQPAHPRS